MIHKYKLGGMNIVLDVNSGGVHVVDELTYDLLDNVEPPFEDECPGAVVEKLERNYKKEDILSCYEEIKDLYRDKILFSPDEYEKFAKFATPSPIKAMCLLVAMDCNMRCTYCFAGQGDYCQGRKLMSFETGKKALDFLLINSGNRENLEVDFFGGEPLMNWNVVKQLVEYGRSKEEQFHKKFRFTVTTNGTLLTEDKMDFINREMSNVVLSIDGRKNVNDRMRPIAGGKGSYDVIMDRYKQIVDKRGHKDYYVRGTYTRYNLDFAQDVMHLVDNGFKEVSVEPVVTDPSHDYALTERDIPKIFSEYENLAEMILQRNREGKHFNFFHFMLDLNQGPCAIKRLRGCGCGNEYVAVTPDAEIYPCHQFVGMKEYLMGNVDTGEFDQRMKKQFAGAHIYSKTDCKTCWARFYCSGGCNANNYEYMGDILTAHKISCEIEKKRLECAIMIQAAEAMEGRNEDYGPRPQMIR